MIVLTISILLVFAGQPLQVPAFQDEAWDSVFTARELEKLGREDKVDKRIKIYESAWKRLHAEFLRLVKAGRHEELTGSIQAWLALVDRSSEDIERNIRRDKKSKPLISYEIKIRRAIADVTDLKPMIPFALEATIQEWLDRAEQTRKRFVDILFQR